MWLVRSALRRPVTILVAVVAIALCSILALQRMPADIFPNLGGMDPVQMEGYPALIVPASAVNVPRGVAVTPDTIEVFGPLQTGDMIVKRATDEIREGTKLK